MIKDNTQARHFLLRHQVFESPTSLTNLSDPEPCCTNSYSLLQHCGSREQQSTSQALYLLQPFIKQTANELWEIKPKF